MKTIRASFFKRLFSDERGQTAYILAFGAAGFLAIGGMTIDVGHAYLVRTELQEAANAAALASVDGLWAGGSTDSTPSPTIVAMAEKYDASPASDNTQTGVNGYNYDPTGAGNVTVHTIVKAPCLDSQLVGGTKCSDSNWNYKSNSVKVVEQAVVSTTLMRVFNVKTLTVGATATALPKGKTAPYNIAIILDGTLSMNNTDSTCGGVTEEVCALNAVESMLAHIYPCIGVASCTSDSEYAAVRVSIFTFPNQLTSDLLKDQSCSGTPAWTPYTFPKIPTSDGTPTGTPLTTGTNAGYKPISYNGGTSYATYQVTAPAETSATGVDPDANGFSSNWYPGSGGEAMNPNSVLVKVMGNTSTATTPVATKGCLTPAAYPSPTGPSEGETYFAGAIYAAQAALQVEKPVADSLIHTLLGTTVNSTNVIIFVSDGQANAYYSSSVSRFPALGSTATTAGSLGVGGYSISGTAPTTTWATTAKNMKNGGGSWGTYPDANNDCQQAMMAAHYAANQGTEVFGIAYGSETNGCLTTGPSGYPGVDNTSTSALTVSGTFNVPISTPATIVPCVTIENIADSWDHFFAETSSTGCASTIPNPVTPLIQIFNQLTGDLGPSPRLVPNNT